MKLSLGISPCPNDTFAFDALLNGRIESKFKFDTHFEDVAQLNKWAADGKLDVTKISFHAWAKLCNEYQLLNSGAALGFGVGPLLISKKEISNPEAKDLHVAVPGLETTANFLLSYAYPKVSNKTAMLFSDIEDAILSGKVDAGVIIHENRFTYQEKGLQLVKDLGQHWEDTTKKPIPLGGIAVKRHLPTKIKLAIQQEIKESIQHAFKFPTDSAPFVKEYAQEMDPDVTKKHIELYVNEYSIDLGETGKGAVSFFLRELLNFNIIDNIPSEAILAVHNQ